MENLEIPLLSSMSEYGCHYCLPKASDSKRIDRGVDDGRYLKDIVYSRI